jgi:hypothetical protein
MAFFDFSVVAGDSEFIIALMQIVTVRGEMHHTCNVLLFHCIIQFTILLSRFATHPSVLQFAVSSSHVKIINNKFMLL